MTVRVKVLGARLHKFLRCPPIIFCVFLPFFILFLHSWSLFIRTVRLDFRVRTDLSPLSQAVATSS